MHKVPTPGKSPSDNCKSSQPASRRPVWSYARNVGWTRVDDPLPPDNRDEGLDEWFSRCGFHLQMDYADGTSALSLAIYSDCQERFILVLGDANRGYIVHVEGMPNYVAVLNEVLPAVRGVAELEDRVERQEEAIERRRRGPVYNAAKRCME